MDGPRVHAAPDGQDVTFMRALVKQTLSREHVDTLVRDLANTRTLLDSKGGAHTSERARVVTGPGH